MDNERADVRHEVAGVLEALILLERARRQHWLRDAEPNAARHVARSRRIERAATLGDCRQALAKDIEGTAMRSMAPWLPG